MAAHQRFRVPSRNGEVLAVPDFDDISDSIEENRRRLASSDVQIGGFRLRDLRVLARSEVLAQCESPGTDVPGLSFGPLILTGHQPELSHPGVWVKNFVLHGLARKVGGIPLNLIVDNDTLKNTSLRFPMFRTGEPATAHVESIPFDTNTGEVSYEDRLVLDGELFRGFPDRAASLWRNWGYEPLLPKVWRDDRTIAGAFIAARQSCERAWGCHNRELTVSRLSQTAAFGQFARHILNDLPRFREVYNAAIQSYRRVNRTRSQSHPAPELGADEAPFWVRTGTAGQRERATTTSNIHKLRPRALTLTLFVRLCLGDFFIHGIGGGKYDEVTDRIIRDYFGIEPPAYQVLSATLHLPLPAFPATVERVKRMERRLRDLHWNPQFYLSPEHAAHPTVKQLLTEKDRLTRSEPPLTDHPARRHWFRALQEVTDHLRPFVAEQIPTAEEDNRLVRAEVEANGVLQRRDYAWVLYPEATLRPFLQQYLSL
jgi:hypothetical protein